ncbi:MAG: FGGY family carbohydrate kinase [Spirosomataceae bacterium]
MLLSIDQGTSSTKTLLFDEAGQILARASEPLKTAYLSDGFVEQDPEEVLSNVLISVEKCLTDFKSKGYDLSLITACGISNQRETFVLWDKTGKPLYNAVVWQCKRSVSICERLKQEGLEAEITQKTGLILDPYFSGTKLLWLYENNPEVKEAIDAGNAYFGTIDTWLLYKLTNGKSFATDHTNASRTLFFNLQTQSWDGAILENFGLSSLNLAEIKPSSAYFGDTNLNGLLPQDIAITGMIGDSHAAAFGEGCFSAGTAKVTMGTGCSILMNIGEKAMPSTKGMMTTVCWSTEKRTDFALEGVIVSCGATVEWLKNEMGLFENSRETEAMASSLSDNGGVYLVPAFSGLGAPHWQMNRKASIVGLTFGTTKNHLVRAALESIAYQVKDVIVAMEADTGISLTEIVVDGGISVNRFVMQFLADLLGIPVINIGIADVSALGAAYVAGLKSGLYTDFEQLKQLNNHITTVNPSTERGYALEAYQGWKRAINANE